MWDPQADGAKSLNEVCPVLSADVQFVGVDRGQLVGRRRFEQVPGPLQLVTGDRVSRGVGLLVTTLEAIPQHFEGDVEDVQVDAGTAGTGSAYGMA
jgi:hypothetical protein